MSDYTRIIALTEETHKAFTDGNLQEAEKVGRELCEVFSAEFPQATRASEYTPEMARIQFDALSAILEVHILRGDGFDIGIRASQFLNNCVKQKKLLGWSDEKWRPMVQIMLRCIREVDDFYTEDARRRVKKTDARNAHCKCMLCRKQPATKTGSHMVPHFLIARTFSYDGSTDREKVVVEATSLSRGIKERYFGHEVYDDTVNELLGRSFTDEEIEAEMAKPNVLTRDYYFCKDCEDRFGVIESYYSEILDGRLKDYPPHIPYLFWLSVAWRMSIGGMGFKMIDEHEEKLRNILNKCLALSREGIKSKKSKLGHCAYSLYRASDTRDETLGILAPHTPTKPYMALIGNLLLSFYTSENAAKSFSRNHGIHVEDLNFGTGPEKIGSLSFIEFWDAKRQILDMNYEDERDIWNMGQERNQTLSQVKPIPDYLKKYCSDGVRPEDMEIRNWMNTENTHALVVPHAVQKIIDWLEKHPGANREELSAGTGYSQEELATILSYWVGKCDELEVKQKENDRKARVLGGFLDLLD